MQRILDAHIHLGEDCVFDETQTEEQIVAAMEAAGGEGGIVQPYIPRMYVEDTKAAHDRIAAFCRAHPGRFYGMMSMNPHFSRDDYEREAKR
jgi:predicted TIM-barrel fold metal-dependent hydrolase